MAREDVDFDTYWLAQDFIAEDPSVTDVDREVTSSPSLLNPFFSCCVAARNFELAAHLPSRGADINWQNLGYTTLFASVEGGEDNIDQIVWLLQRGADVNCRSINDWTPLHYAAAKGWEAMVRALIDYGGDVNLRTRIDDFETPLMEAGNSGHMSVVQMLLQYGADPETRVNPSTSKTRDELIDEFFYAYRRPLGIAHRYKRRRRDPRGPR